MATTEEAQAAEFLERSLALMEGHWIQGDYRRMIGDEESFCSMGAMSEIRNQTPFNSDARRRAVRTLSQVIPDEYSNAGESPRNKIIRFNDGKNTTFEDITQVFRRAIGKLRNG